MQSRSILPEGNPRAKIRWSKRCGADVKEGTLGETLGQETKGMVVVGGSCQPMTYAAVGSMKAMAATQDFRIDVQLPNPDGKGWSPESQRLDVSSCPELGAEWREDLTTGANFLIEETWVPPNDPHYDAKCWPAVHPYSSGSLLSEPGTGGAQRFARNRLALSQSWFRKSASHLGRNSRYFQC